MYPSPRFNSYQSKDSLPQYYHPRPPHPQPTTTPWVISTQIPDITLFPLQNLQCVSLKRVLSNNITKKRTLFEKYNELYVAQKALGAS